MSVALWNIPAELVAAGNHALQIGKLALWEGSADLIVVDVDVLKMDKIADAGMQLCETSPTHLQELQRLCVDTDVRRELWYYIMVQI